jgi:hypothetical protein
MTSSSFKSRRVARQAAKATRLGAEAQSHASVVMSLSPEWRRWLYLCTLPRKVQLAMECYLTPQQIRAGAGTSASSAD